MASAHLKLSNPYDHYDPRIQLRCQDRSITDALSHFRSKRVGASNLRHLGDELAPSKNKKLLARKVVDKVTSVVKACEGISLDRCCVSGSLGKATAVGGDFDVDLVIFMNDATPPFEYVISKLEKYLPRALPGIEIEKTTRFSIQFILDGFNVDLLPAANLVQSPLAPKATIQHRLVMEKIKTIPDERVFKDIRYWSPALAETTVAVMKKQQPFVMAAVRLGKLWKKSCQVLPITFPIWFSSFLVEVIVTDAANTELKDNPNDASLVRVLENFLLAMSKPEKLCIVTDSDFVRRSEIPAWIANQRPLVLDPVNPYCNLASQLGNWPTVRLLALSTLEKLKNSRDDSSPTLILDLFRPRLGGDIPRMYRMCNFQLRFVVGTSWIKSLQVRKISDLQGQRMNPGVEWRSQERLDKRACSEEIQNRIHVMFKNCVQVSTMALLHQVSQERQDQAEERVSCGASNFVDTMLSEVFGTNYCNWTPTTDTHKSRDVSLIFGQVPIPSPKDDLRYIYLKLSTNLDDVRLYRLAHDMERDLERQREEEEDMAY